MILLTLALLVTSCSDDDPASVVDSTIAPTTTAPTTTPSDEPAPETGSVTTVPTTEEPTPSTSRSGVRSVIVESTEDHGTFGGVAYVRVTGRIEGVVDPSEPVAGLSEMATDDLGLHPYSAAFDMIRPAEGGATVLVEAPNRGNGLLLGLLGEDFVLAGGRAYATVAWQTELNPDVPASAQGVGEVIVRDFGRLLDGGRAAGTASPLGGHEHRLLAGWSQGAWFATTLVAEGFNVDPSDGTGVFDGVIAVSGAGHVLAINQASTDGRPQEPYIRPDAAPLTAEEILTRPGSDPLFVDIVNYTDFYRLRAGLGAGGDVDGYWRYDWPSAHAPGSIASPAIVFDTFGCNGGTEVPVNPVDFRPYLRAVLVGLETELGAPVAEDQAPATTGGLPPSAEFVLTDTQPAGTGSLNPLPGTPIPVPEVDDALWPRGGVGFVEAAVPLGSPSPVALPPVTTASITEVCGNFGGWAPSPASAVLERWPTVQDHLADGDAALEELIGSRYVLPRDRDTVRADAERAYAERTAG